MDTSTCGQEELGIELPTQRLGDDRPDPQLTFLGCTYCIMGSNTKPGCTNYTAVQLLWFSCCFWGFLFVFLFKAVVADITTGT